MLLDKKRTRKGKPLAAPACEHQPVDNIISPAHP